MGVCVRRGWGSDVPFLEVSFFWPGFDVKANWSCFDGVVCCAVFNIHAADQERRGEKEWRGDFWSNRKLICS